MIFGFLFLEEIFMGCVLLVKEIWNVRLFFHVKNV